MSNRLVSIVLLFSSVLLFSLNSFNVISVYGQSLSSSINWGEMCRTFDLLIIEPRETLTTADGYTLTSEGSRVFVVCIGGGAVATLLGYPEAILSLGNIARCGETTAASDTITNLLAGR